MLPPSPLLSPARVDRAGRQAKAVLRDQGQSRRCPRFGASLEPRMDRKQSEHHAVRIEESRRAEINPQQTGLLCAVETASGIGTKQQPVSMSGPTANRPGQPETHSLDSPGRVGEASEPYLKSALDIRSQRQPIVGGMAEPTSATSGAALRTRLDGLTIRDAAYFGRRLKNLRGAAPEKLRQLANQIAKAEALVATRHAAVPTITYPDLPVSERRQEIADALRAHQVVVVAGETGSGKTTQLPKICLDIGRGIRGTIGHTQPRRLAARTVAQRIADELGSPLGDAVGYTVRFTDQVSDRTLVKLMTDGILLAEIQRDRRLLRYDTLILDEAHERSLNIDFLLGYLRELLPRRPDLKVIVTSATIEPQRFAAHFGGAPIVEVSGRTYPVEIRYRPLEVAVSVGSEDDPDDPDHEIVRTEIRDEIDAIVDAIHELEAEPPGDVLVFLSGEREIRDTAEALTGLTGGPGHTEVLPLYARLPTAEQQKVFAPHTGRRVVLATNVAETSLTVPGIRYVVDPGNARISRYSRRLKVQRLPIEPVSQASAAQRAGRSGRLAPGVCIRLYSEDDFAARPRYTDPEILRTNLAAVILQMAALQLGEVENFPFLDPPDRRSIRDGVQLLQELGAFDPHGAITDLGRRLARLPVDPRLGRMILQAETEGVCAGGAGAGRGAVDPRPAGAARRPRGGRAPEACPFRRRELRLHVLPEPLATICANSEKHYLAVLFDGCVVMIFCTICASASGRTSSGSCAASPAT